MLASKRGLGRDELRYATGEFLEAIRWVAFVERLAPSFVEDRVTAATDPHQSIVGDELVAFRARRERARARIAEVEPVIYPPDEGSDG